MEKKISETTSIRLPIELKKHLNNLAVKRQLSLNKYMVNALIKYSGYKEEK